MGCRKTTDAEVSSVTEEANRGTDRAPEAAFDGQKKDAGKLRLDLVPLDAVSGVGQAEGEDRDTLDLLTRIFSGGEIPKININQKEAEGVARVLEMGAKKYSERGWEKGIQFSRVYAAGLRHILADEYLDAESGLPHAHHALCNLLFLSRFIRNPDRYIAFDDRPRPFVEIA